MAVCRVLPMGMHHPWGELRRRRDVTLHWARLPHTLTAVTDGRRSIWMAMGLRQVERRCAIDHELAHIELGHECGPDPSHELAASTRSARRLITVTALEDAVRWTTSLPEMADMLWVTEDVLTVRLHHLHPAETALLRRAAEHHRDGRD